MAADNGERRAGVLERDACMAVSPGMRACAWHRARGPGNLNPDQEYQS